MPDINSFRQLMGCFATGVTVVTAEDAKHGPIGITINSITSVSLKPLLVLFCLEKKAHVYSPFKKAGHFAVNILTEKQEDISRYFADYRSNPKPKKIWDKPQHGCPILSDTFGWMVCKKIEAYKGGDHTIFLGKVVGLQTHDKAHKPLVYFNGRYRKIKT